MVAQWQVVIAPNNGYIEHMKTFIYQTSRDINYEFVVKAESQEQADEAFQNMTDEQLRESVLSYDMGYFEPIAWDITEITDGDTPKPISNEVDLMVRVV